MISFCAKILALCYFKIPGLASSLLQALKMRPSIMKKLQAEMTNKSAHLNAQYKENLKLVFPPYLHQLMAPDIQSYKHYFADIKTQKIKSPVSLSGNWIRRWKSDDSELFFSFYRHYHSTLKSYVMAVHPIIHRQQLHQRNAILMVSPGYMYFASFFAGKVDSLINREINSVTTVVDQQMATNNVKKNSFLSSTIAPVDNISMIDETKPFMEGYNDYTAAKAHYNTPTGKPKALEMATRRYAECMTWCIVAADPVGLYHDMINVWIRFAIKRTVLTEAEGVYCLLDFIEQTILELQKFPLKRNYFPIDLPFILHTLDIILSRSDHSISLLRALSFIYVHFGFLTSHAALLDLLCNRIMLDTVIFERLLLHWGKNVRIFFLRCLMWRVGRVWHPTGIRWNSEAEQMVKMMVRENKDAAMCDGLSCWSQWINKSNDKLLSQVPNEVKAYRQCSLEIHIVLEALMASFHRNHTYFQNTFTSLPNHKKLDLVTSTTEGSSSLPQTSERTKQFSSQLAVPPIDYNSLPTPFSTYISSGNNYQNFNPNNLIGNSHKRSRPSTNFKKRHMITRSRTGKGRLLKLFNSNVSLLSNNGNIVAEDSSMAGNNVDNEAVNDADTLHLREFYTVPGNYTVSSILLTEDSKLVQESKLYPLPTIPNTMLGKSLDLNGEQVQCTAPIDDSANLFGHHYQVCELSQMPSPVCLIIQKDLEDIICYSQEVSNEKDLDSSKNDDPPDMLVHARNWKYHPSNHVYASKILSEMKVIMHEYCVWLEKTHESRSSSSMIFVPRLSLDWPKNWTFSHSY
ncbi:hypothetical protein EDC94DRAFT_593188 [Helicostylum pulchrum]|nr:hypothetical protein EDC94DRAFT_593188 [Helicostylum pulchrum]